MKDIVISIFVILFGIAAIVGYFICGVNVLYAIFMAAGVDCGGHVASWTGAIVGFSLAASGSVISQFLSKFVGD